MSAAEMIPYEGDEALRDDVLHAIGTVVDPEMGLSVVDVGLVYGVRVEPSRVHVEITMTSAACPVAGLIADEMQAAVRGALPDDRPVEVTLCWDPPWTPERMSDLARQMMGW
jgi:metal-sulfur cluster biosynthetic enzyme